MEEKSTLTPIDFVLKTSLYDKRLFKTQEDLESAQAVLKYSGTYDNYCTECSKESTFQLKPSEKKPAYIYYNQHGDKNIHQ